MGAVREGHTAHALDGVREGLYSICLGLSDKEQMGRLRQHTLPTVEELAVVQGQDAGSFRSYRLTLPLLVDHFLSLSTERGKLPTLLFV